MSGAAESLLMFPDAVSPLELLARRAEASNPQPSRCSSTNAFLSARYVQYCTVNVQCACVDRLISYILPHNATVCQLYRVPAGWPSLELHCTGKQHSPRMWNPLPPLHVKLFYFVKKSLRVRTSCAINPTH